MKIEFPSSASCMFMSTSDYGYYPGYQVVQGLSYDDPDDEYTCPYCGCTQNREDALNSQNGRRPGCLSCGAPVSKK